MVSSPTGIAEAPIPYRRRHHKKSRTGCFECRRRRVKCPEDKPRCRCCVRQGAACHYPVSTAPDCYPTPTADSPTTEVSPLQSVVEPAVSTVLSYSSPPNLVETPCEAIEFTLEDMSLLHHWTVSTSLSITKFPSADYFWQKVLPQIAFKHPFVMHGILSLTSLHLAHLGLGDKRRHVSEAASRHNQALQGLTTAMANISDDNSKALFVSATINVVYVFGMYGDLYDNRDADQSHSAHITRILGAEWIPMIRGLEAVLSPIYDTLRFGSLGPLLDLGIWDALNPDLEPVAGDEQLQRLRTIWVDHSDHELYDQSLHLLRKCHAFMAQFSAPDEDSNVELASYNRTWSGPLMWLHFVPEDFLLRLRQRQPPALVIFAHLGVLLHTLDDIWLFKGWSRNIVMVVDELLGEYWELWMQWPKEVVTVSC